MGTTLPTLPSFSFNVSKLFSPFFQLSKERYPGFKTKTIRFKPLTLKNKTKQKQTLSLLMLAESNFSFRNNTLKAKKASFRSKHLHPHYPYLASPIYLSLILGIVLRMEPRLIKQVLYYKTTPHPSPNLDLNLTEHQPALIFICWFPNNFHEPWLLVPILLHSRPPPFTLAVWLSFLPL